MDVTPMDWSDWMDGWQNVAIWGIIMSIIVCVAIVWGVVMIVRALASRNRTAPGSRTCKSCGVLVAPGNMKCPTCKAQMDWT